MADHEDTPPRTPDEEAGLALQAMAQGKPAQAAFHLSVALAQDCTNPDWLAVLDKLIAASEDPLQLAPIESEVHIAVAALHAYILARLGRKAEALDVLLQVTMALPVDQETIFLPYFDWALAWAADPAAAAAFPLARVDMLLGWMLERYPGLIVHSSPARSVLQQVWLFLQKIPPQLPRSEAYHFGHAALLRKLGWLNDALTAAEEAYRLAPGYRSAMGLALVYEAREEYDSWLEYVRRALEENPDDLGTRLQAADKLWEIDRSEEASGWYAEVLDREPGHPWAEPSLLALRYELTQDRYWLEQLQAYAAAHTDNERVGPLLQKHMAYLGFLPEPADDLLKLFDELFEKFAGPPTDETQVARIPLPALEAPSARLVGDLQVQALGWPLEFRFEVAHVPQPDTRLPLRPVTHKLWDWWDTTPLPAVPVPSLEIVETFRDFAFSPYRLDVWLARARQLAEHLTEEDLPDLLGIMVHPPELPPGVPGWLWIQHVQIAAALTIGWLNAEEPWEGSLRREVLVDLAYGCPDWTVSAAVIALMGLAQVQPALQEEVFGHYLKMLHSLSDYGHTPQLHPLLCCALYLPVGDDQLRAQLGQWKNLLEGEEPPSSETPSAG